MTASDNSIPNDVQHGSADWAEIRKKAVRRSWFCPGAGFALIGRGALATATFASSALTLAALAWFAFQPSAVSFWTTIAVAALMAILSVAEQSQIKRAEIRSPSPAFLDRGFVIAGCLVWLAILPVLGLLLTSFGVLVVAGSGMAPTLRQNEKIIYYKRIDWQSVKPGALIVFRNPDGSAWSEPGLIVVARILAGPNDSIATRNGRYVVNGAVGPPVAATGEYDVVLRVPSHPGTLTVPDGCYFVVQDSPAGGFDSRVLSWVRSENIIGSRLWLFGRRGFFQPVTESR